MYIPQNVKLQRVQPNEEIPANAVLLTREEVLHMKSEVLEKWEPTSEMWPLKKGYRVIIGLTAISAGVFEGYFRKVFKLGFYRKATTFGMSVLVPSAISGLTHHVFVTSQLLDSQKHCSVCTEIRSLSLQAVSGVASTFSLSLLSSLLVGSLRSSILIPDWNQVQEWKKFGQKYGRGLKTQALGVVALNVAVCSLLTYKEMEASIRFHSQFDVMQQKQMEER